MGQSTVDAKFAAIVPAAGLDAERARAWTLVRGVQNWLWSLAGGGFPGSARLARITCWAAGSTSL
jgi:streptomycin 6-kinase